MKIKLFTMIALAAAFSAGCSSSEKDTFEEPDDPEITDPDNPDPKEPKDPQNPDNPPNPIDNCANVDLTSNSNCGACGNRCGENSFCRSGVCTCSEGFSDCDGNNTCETEGECICHKGDTMPCYSGSPETENVGNCHGGFYHCIITEDYGADWDYICEGEVAPFLYPVCSTDNPKGDSDCNGVPDYYQDDDDDGFAACSSFGTMIDCCDTGLMCSTDAPDFVYPGKLIDCVGNKLDDDCDGEIDEDEIECETGQFVGEKCPLNERMCDEIDTSMDNWDQRVKTGSAALALARAMDLCMNIVSASSGQAGIIEYSLSKSSLIGPSHNAIQSGQVAVLEGMNGKNARIEPRIGKKFLMLSTGKAGDATNVSSDDVPWDTEGKFVNKVPELYLNAHNNKLQSHPNCSSGGVSSIFDSAVLHLKLKAPTTAQGFSFDFRFFSKEYPYYVCSSFNDFFLTVVTDEDGKPFVDTNADYSILDEDGNVSFDKQGNAVSVNNAFFTTCFAPKCGNHTAMGFLTENTCPGSISCTEDKRCGICEDGYQDLFAYTPTPYTSDEESGATNRGGGTAWLTTNVPVSPGQIFNLDFYIWDTGDPIYDSSVIIDNFRWHCDETAVGTDFAKPIDEIM